MTVARVFFFFYRGLIFSASMDEQSAIVDLLPVFEQSKRYFEGWRTK